MTLEEFIKNNNLKLLDGVYSQNVTDNFLDTVKSIYSTGARLVLMSGLEQDNVQEIRYLFNSKHIYLELKQKVEEERYDSIYNIYFNAVFFEREIAEMFGWVATSNMQLSTMIKHGNMAKDVYPLRKSFAWNTKLEWEENQDGEFYEVKGPGVYEIPVGPIHAGVIEPGHFRFSLAGERILNVQPQLYYQHKGTEKLFENIDSSKYIHLAERISGDTSVSHSLAHIQAVEKIGKIVVPKRAKYIRVILSEFERIYNHVNDIGFIGQDTGFGIAGSQGTRLKELVLRQNIKWTGSRILRNVLTYGGVKINPTKEQVEDLINFVQIFSKDFYSMVEMFEDIPTMISRMQDCGVLKKDIAKDFGAVGLSARACGISIDTRVYNPYDAYENISVDIQTSKKGDVRARYKVRVKEVIESLKIIEKALRELPKGEVIDKKFNLSSISGEAYGITEGWRGEIVHFVSIDKGKIIRAKIKDPSFSNWPVMVPAINGNIIGDFPLINKSFNLSYSGNDL